MWRLMAFHMPLWLWAEPGPLAVAAEAVLAKGTRMISKPKKTAAQSATVLATSPAQPASKQSDKNKRPPAKQKEASGKLGKLVSLLKRPNGASLADLMKATGWQAHSVRGAISGTLKKKLKLAVLSEKAGGVRTYRIKA